jgi:hypothetical protein
MRIGQKVKWFNPAINDYPIEERETQRNRVYTIIKYINDEMCLIADELGESEVLITEIEPLPIAVYDEYKTQLVQSAIEKLKTLGGTMSFENLYHQELDEDGVVEDYEDMRPQIIVANRHCEIGWTIVLSVILGDDKVIRVETDDYGEIPLTYAEGETDIYIYKAILFN